MPGAPGRPGKSISAPQVMLSPAEQTRGEGGNTAFYCTVAGNLSPVVEWQFKGRKLQPSAKYLIKEGELIVRNLNYSDAGPYTCAARNILGSSEATSNLSVRGEREIFIFLVCYNRPLNFVYMSSQGKVARIEQHLLKHLRNPVRCKGIEHHPQLINQF